MTAETKKLVRDLRSYARKYKDGSTLGRAIIDTEDIMFAAANAIESLAEVAEKASARAAMCDTVMDEAAKMKLELDDLKRIAQETTPPAGAEVVRLGHWEKVYEIQRFKVYRCNFCGRHELIDETSKSVSSEFPYCHCGAKMNGGSEG